MKITYFYSSFRTVPPTLTSDPRPVLAYTGETAVLRVKVASPVSQALVKENFTWTKGITKDIPSTGEVQTDGSLQLRNVQLADTGDYMCTAVNAAGSGVAVVRLEVLPFGKQW